jgi:hypothetical protein
MCCYFFGSYEFFVFHSVNLRCRFGQGLAGVISGLRDIQDVKGIVLASLLMACLKKQLSSSIANLIS